MCKEIIQDRRYMCRHRIVDEPSVVLPWDGCGGCGEIKTTQKQGRSTLRELCENCKEDGSWELLNGLWMRQADAERMRIEDAARQQQGSAY